MTDYYERKELSNSALGYLDVGVQYFKERMAGADDENIYSIMGNAIHTFILEGETIFNERYVIAPRIRPSSAQQKSYCSLRAKGMKSLEAANLSYKKATIESAAILETEYSTYIEFLRNTNNKKIISKTIYEACVSIKRNIKNHKLANTMMFDDVFTDNTVAENEKAFFFEIQDIPFKGKLDRLIINYDTKEVTIIDLKTYTLRNSYTSRIKFIKAKLKQRDIDRQLAVYKSAVQQFLNDEGFTFKYYVVFTSTDLNNYVDVLRIDDKTIDIDGSKKIEIGLNKYRTYLTHEESFHDEYYHQGDGSLFIEHEN